MGPRETISRCVVFVRQLNGLRSLAVTVYRSTGFLLIRGSNFLATVEPIIQFMKITLIENFRAVFYIPYYASIALGAYRNEGIEIPLAIEAEPSNGGTLPRWKSEIQTP